MSDLPNEVPFASIPGGSAFVEWFGSEPNFHDATLIDLVLADGSAILRLKTFRMTNRVAPGGHYILDRHAVVTLHLSGVTGVSLIGNAASIILCLNIQRVDVTPSGFSTCAGPGPTDYRIRLEATYGLEGSIFARSLSMAFVPIE